VELYEGEMKALISDLTEITGTLPLLHTGKKTESVNMTGTSPVKRGVRLSGG